MAGDMRIGGTGIGKTRKSRKLWSLQDRSVMSIHLLKATLAEDGCEEAQLDVAKKLLNGDSDDIPAEAVQSENARLAIYWLIKSSEQGNEEATKLLSECFESGQGVTCQNVLDVKTCITTPLNEKLVFKAAKLLFERLNNGEEFITTTQLWARLESRKFDPKVSFDPTPQPEETSNQGKPKSSSPKSSSGSPPNSDFNPNRTFIIDSPLKDASMSATSDEDSFIHIETQCPLRYRDQDGIKLTLLEMLKVVVVYNQGHLPPVSINSNTQIGPQQKWNFVSVWNAFILQLIIASMAFGFTSQFYALLLTSTFLSLWSSYNFVIWKKRKSTFEDWTEVFRSVLQQKKWSNAEPAGKFTKKYFRPYLLTNAGCLIFFSLIDGDPGLKIFAGVLSLFGLIRGKIISPIPSWQLVAVVSIQILSNHATLSAIQDWNILRLLDVDFTVLVHYWIPSYAYDYIPTNFASVFLSIQVIIILHYIIYNKTMFSFPSLPSVLAGFWLLEICQWSFDYTSYEDFAIVVGAVIFVIALFLCIECDVPVWKILTTLGLAAAVIYLSYYGMKVTEISSPEANETSSLDWSEYERNCHLTAWKTQTMAETQMNCLLKYENARVTWKGKISLVNLNNHDKRPWDSKLINLVFEVLVNAALEESGNHMEMANLWKWQNYIPLNGYQSYQEHVAPVSLRISTKGLTDFDRASISRHILNFRTGDIIEFSGSVTKNLGSLKPEIGDVESLKCIKCSTAEYGLVVLKRNNLYSVASEHILKAFNDFKTYILSFRVEEDEEYDEW